MKRLTILSLLLALVLAAFGLLPVPTAVTTSVPEASANVATFNSNCTQDVTQAMQNFLASGGVHELVPGGCYKVNGKLTFSSTLDGKNAEIRKTSQQNLDRCDGFDCDPTNASTYGDVTGSRSYCGQHAGMVELKSGGVIKNVTLHRLGPHSYNPCHYAEHGIEVRGASDITIANVDIEGVWGDCLYMQGASDLESTDLDCISNGRQGGAISKGRNIHLNGFYVRDSDRSGFDFEANGDSVEDGIYNVEIENFLINTDDDKLGVPEEFPKTEQGKIAFPSQGFNSPDSDIYIHDGTVQGALSGVYDRQLSPRTGPGQCGGGRRKNWRVENVIFDESVSDYGYGFRSATDRTMPVLDAGGNGTTVGSPKATAIFCQTEGVRFIGNRMPGGYLTLENVTGTVIVSNNCYAGLTQIAQTSPVTVSNNTVGGACSGGTVTKPGAPIIRTAVAGDTQATVNFSPPTNNGGAPITQYTVTRTPGGLTTNGTQSPIVVTGLSNGTAYTFKVKATNSAGTGPDSAASNSVTPRAGPTEPGAPTSVTASGGDGRCTVTFTAPASNGGSAITSYMATSTPSSITKTGTASPLVVTGLQNGTAYTFKVAATNAIGTGAESSASNSCTPSGGDTVPTAPTIGTVTAGDRSAVVAWSAPSSNGGAAINAYIVYQGNTTAKPVAYKGPNTPLRLTVQNLTNDTPYQFTVRAQNAVGLGPPSDLSATVTPTEDGSPTVPDAPTIGTATAGDTQATVTWTPPVDDGGTQITGYKITSSPATVTKTVDGDVTSYEFPGLSNGQAYTFTVKATNAIGDSSASSASNSVTPTAQTTQVAPCELQDFTAVDGLDPTRVERINDEMQRFCRAVRAVVTGSYTSSTPLCDNFAVDADVLGDEDRATELETGLRVACQGLRGLAPLGGSTTTAPTTAPHAGGCDAITFVQQTGMDTNRTARAQEAARNICVAFQNVVTVQYDSDADGPACDNATVTPPSGTTSPTISVFAAAVAQVGWRGTCEALQEPPAESACSNIQMDTATGLVGSEVDALSSAMSAACDATRNIDDSGYSQAANGQLCSHIRVTNAGLSAVAVNLLQDSWRDACFSSRHLLDTDPNPNTVPECEQLQLTPLPGTDPADYILALEAMRQACNERLGG